MKLYLLSYLLVAALIGCDQPKHSELKESNPPPKKKAKEGLVVHYRPDGEVLSEINYKEKKKDGIAKTYYKNGTLHQEINYENGLKHGLATTYYENGNLFRITPYKSGKIDGVQKKYRENGNLMAEVPFKNEFPGKGLKEYLVGGKLKTKYPEIVIEPVDNMIKKGSYHLKLSVSEKVKAVDFYVGDLDGGYLHDGLTRIAPRSSNCDYQLDFYVPPGTFIMQKINIVCNVTTILGNPYIIEKKYNLAVENQGF